MKPKKKPVLIACEASQTVCKAFRKRGIEAYSCDVEETYGENPEWHLKMDVFEALKLKSWEMMIAFPPCTYLTSAGLHYCNIELHGDNAIARIKERNKAIEFFLDLYAQPIDYICLENPVGHISSTILKPTQIIHPWYFGDRKMKRTALWLKNLPPLQYSMCNDLFGLQTATEKPLPYATQVQKKTGKIKNRYFVDGEVRSNKARSKTFPAIAEAMADQWSKFIFNEHNK